MSVKRVALFFVMITVANGAALAGMPDAVNMPASSVLASMNSNWSGFYVGLNGGYAFNDPAQQVTLSDSQRQIVNNSPFAAAFAGAGNQSLPYDAFTGGAQLGYNFQWNNWLVGLETDFDGSEQNSLTIGNATNVYVSDANGATTITKLTTIAESANQQWNFTVRPRMGYVLGNFLLYATGGFALTEVQYQSQVDWGVGTSGHVTPVNNPLNSLATTSGNFDNVLPGWTVGGGLEWKITPVHWSVAGQYLYSDYASANDSSSIVKTTTASVVPGASVNTKGSFSNNVVTLRLNYRF